MKLKTKSYHLIYILICIFFCHSTFAQTPDHTIDLDGAIAPPAVDITYTIGDADFRYRIAPGDFTVSVAFDTDDDPLDLDSGLSVNFDPDESDPEIGVGWITIEPNATPPVTGVYPVVVHAVDQAGPANEVFQQYNITVVRQPIAVVMVLDRSGSMGSPPDGGVAPPNRMEILKTAASLFITKLEDFSIAEDSLALTYFESDADMPPPLFGNELTEISGNADNFKNDINGQDPGSATAMGDGLLAGKNKLNDATESRKFIFLFTDGEQYPVDQVNALGTESEGISLNNGDGSIQIIAIGTGAASTGDAASILAAIANSNTAGGTPYYFFLQEALTDLDDIDSATGVVDFFDSTFETMLSGSSPQTVGEEKGIMQAQLPVKNDFHVNANINKLLFELLTTDDEPIISIEKDGVPINSSNASLRIIRGPHTGLQSVLAIVDLDASSPITSQGIWSVNASSGTGGGKPFKVKAQVDDHRLNYTFEVTSENSIVEDVLKIEANLKYDNVPIEDATIKAFVSNSETDLADALARANVKFNPDLEGDVASIGYQKLLALIEDNPALIDSLKLKENIVSLTHSGGGKYNADYANTSVTGPYKIIGTISGSKPGIGNYERLIRRSAYLRFKDPDPVESSSQYTTLSNNSFQILYTPKYKANGQVRFVGPGFANGLDIIGAEVTNVATTDNGDGSYKSIVTTSGNNNPDIAISLSGVDIYDGPASSFGDSGNFLTKLIKWLMNTLGIPAWLAYLLLILLILIIIWLIRKLFN